MQHETYQGRFGTCYIPKDEYKEGIRKATRNALIILALATIATLAWAKKDPQLSCLAEVVWRESRGEHWSGKLEVMRVVQNRAHQQKKSYCEVVSQKHQFAYRRPHTHDLYHYQFVSFFHRIPLQLTTSTHFHNHQVKPNWKLTPTKTIGNHTFYK